MGQKRTFIELSAAISAVVISLCALLISYKQIVMMEEQMHLSVTPRLSVGLSVNNEEFGLGLMNNGIGPAEIVSTEIKVDDKHVKNWESFFYTLDSTKTRPKNCSTTKLNDILIGEQKYWGMITVNDTLWTKILMNNKHRIAVRVCYKSLFDDWFEVTRSSLELKSYIVNKKVQSNTISLKNRFWGNIN